MSEEMKTRLLVVDDEQSIRRLCMTIGNTLGYACTEAENAEAALRRLESDAPDLILTDLKLPAMSGVELLKQTKKLLPHAEVAIMTGHGSIESAVDPTPPPPSHSPPPPPRPAHPPLPPQPLPPPLPL